MVMVSTKLCDDGGVGISTSLQGGGIHVNLWLWSGESRNSPGWWSWYSQGSATVVVEVTMVVVFMCLCDGHVVVLP